MTKRFVFEGSYLKRDHKTQKNEENNQPKNNESVCEQSIIEPTLEIAEQIFNIAANYLKGVSRWMASNYLVFVLILIVIVFSHLLPDIAQKLQKNSELKSINNVLQKMQDEVKRAEVACLAANEKICDLHSTLYNEGALEPITYLGSAY